MKYIIVLALLLCSCAAPQLDLKAVSLVSRDAYIGEFYVDPLAFSYLEFDPPYIAWPVGKGSEVNALITPLWDDFETSADNAIIFDQADRIMAVSSTTHADQTIAGEVYACIADYSDGARWRFQRCEGGCTVSIQVDDSWDVIAPSGKVYFGVVVYGEGNSCWINHSMNVLYEEAQ